MAVSRPSSPRAGTDARGSSAPRPPPPPRRGAAAGLRLPRPRLLELAPEAGGEDLDVAAAAEGRFARASDALALVRELVPLAGQLDEVGGGALRAGGDGGPVVLQLRDAAEERDLRLARPLLRGLLLGLPRRRLAERGLRGAGLALRRRVLVARARRLGPARGEGLAQRSHAGDEFLRLPLPLAAAGFRLHDLLAAIPAPPLEPVHRQRQLVEAAARLLEPRLEVVEPVTAGLEPRLLRPQGGRCT